MKEIHLLPLDLNNPTHVQWMFEVRSHQDVIPYFFAPPPKEFDEHIRFLKNSAGKREFFIVMEGEHLCGYCQLVHHPDSFEIGFALHPNWWGKGIGTTAAKLLLDYVHRLPKKQIILYVKSDNIRAISLYQKMGFTVAKKEGERCLMVF